MRRSGGFAPFAGVSAAFDRLPIRTRLAGVSALLTFVILCAFALIVGSLTVPPQPTSRGYCRSA
jgi:hypothetical protein